MGNGNEKLNFSAEHREFLPQQIGAVPHAYLFRNTRDEIPLVGDGFDVRNTLLLTAGERLTIQSATATTIPARAFHQICAQGTPSIVACDLGDEECANQEAI